MKATHLINIVLALAVLGLSVLFAVAKHQQPKADIRIIHSDTLMPMNIRHDLHANGFTFFRGGHDTNGILLCVAGENGVSSNAMTIGWGGLGTLWRKDVVTVYVAEKRFTKHLLDKAEYFTVMTFDAERGDILDYMGSHSGRDGDKAAALGLHTSFTANGTPYYDEAKTVMECRIIYREQFNPKGFGDVPREMYADFPAGLHTQYIGEVVGAWTKEKVTH